MYTHVMFEAALAELKAFDPTPFSRPELADALDAHDKVIARAEANRLRILSTIDALGDNGADSERMGRNRSRRSAKTSKRDARTAAALCDMPDVAQMLAEGEITTEHAAAAADAAARTSPKAADELATMASSMPADLFAKKSREWANGREEDRKKEDRLRRQRRKRSVRFWEAGDGMVHLHAELDPQTGAEVVAALRERINELWRADGGREGTPDEARSTEQRAADAFAELMTRTPASLGRGNKPHPRHMVHVMHHLRDGATELVDGTPLPASVLSDIGPGAEVVGHVFSADGRPLWLGRSTRLASRDQWIALIARDRSCTDCAGPVAHCEAHHPHHWEHNGRSDIPNLELKCTRCHAYEHRHDHRRSRQAA
ncbi:MAG: DUF222 domain-containing protein [Actinomycetota bacterium]